VTVEAWEEEESHCQKQHAQSNDWEISILMSMDVNGSVVGLCLVGK
jgi:hypothetical protein